MRRWTTNPDFDSVKSLYNKIANGALPEAMLVALDIESSVVSNEGI